MDRVWLVAMSIALAATLALATLITPANSAEFENKCFENSCEIFLTGEISNGDAAKLVIAISRSPLVVDALVLRSPGGNPFEALEISDVINKYYISALSTSAFCGPSKEFNCHPCAIACALIFMTANARMGDLVYIHRPTFPKEFFGELTAPQTEKAYNNATDKLLIMLRKRRVSDADIQRMMSIPSDTVLPLRKDYGQYSPWLSEWISQRCPYPNVAEDPTRLVDYSFCQTNALRAEASQAQTALREPPKHAHRP